MPTLPGRPLISRVGAWLFFRPEAGRRTSIMLAIAVEKIRRRKRDLIATGPTGVAEKVHRVSLDGEINQ